MLLIDRIDSTFNGYEIIIDSVFVKWIKVQIIQKYFKYYSMFQIIHGWAAEPDQCPLRQPPFYVLNIVSLCFLYFM